MKENEDLPSALLVPEDGAVLGDAVAEQSRLSALEVVEEDLEVL